MTAPTVFISYSHKDEDWKDRLVTHLGVLQHQGQLDVWDDRRIEAGTDWQPQIEQALNAASVAVLLVSANFLTSQFILSEEVPRLLQRRSEQGLRIFPIIVMPCAWKQVGWLSRLQVRLRDGRPLSGGTDYQIDADLAAIAEEIAGILKRTAPADASTRFVSLGPDKVSLAKLPSTSSDLFGREKELAVLDTAWADSHTNLLTLVAWGGVGKTALVNKWLSLLERDNYRGAERVFGWSFYSQGAAEGRQVSADPFIAAALRWFGDPQMAESAASPWDKGERLAELIRQSRTLLILDGLEPLQNPPPVETGRLKDPALSTLLRELARHNPGLVVITTRLAVDDLKDFHDGAAAQIDLAVLDAAWNNPHLHTSSSPLIAMKKARNQIFISYSHKDAKWLQRLQVHLKPLERENSIVHWDDTMIIAGKNWRDEIRKAVNSARVAVLLISADFLASDFIAKNELPPLLSAAATDGAAILPLIVSASRFEYTESLSKFQAVNTPSRPLDKMTKSQREEVFVKLTNDIVIALKQSTESPKFVTIPITSSGLANADLSIYTHPPHGRQEFHGIPFQVENARISMADVYDGDNKIFNLQDPIAGIRAVHFLINAGDGRKRYGKVTIGNIEFVFKGDVAPAPRVEIKLGLNVREWAIGNFVTVTINGRQQYDPLVDSVEDKDFSHEVWRGTTDKGQVAVLDLLTVPIHESKRDKALVAIRFTRNIPQGSALDYFVSGITFECEKETSLTSQST